MTLDKRLEEISERLKANRKHLGSIVFEPKDNFDLITQVVSLKMTLEDRLTDIATLLEVVRVYKDALEFYAQGGHPAMDMWKHAELGYFTGKRAQACLARAEAICSESGE